MVDIYYKGVCYTNSILAQDHEITKSRKKHYIQIIRNPWNEHDWVSLFEHIKNQRHSSSDGSYIHIPVNGSLISLSDRSEERRVGEECVREGGEEASRYDCVLCVDV